MPDDWHVQGVGDFNGDGNSDVLWRQDGSGQMYIWEMNGRQVQAEGAVAHAPVTSDWHVESVGDFNGDGHSDVFWRQDGSGQVYIWADEWLAGDGGGRCRARTGSQRLARLQ
jgi:hypothetical protein